ncbi:hypothetical protein RJ639_028192 [Escallonia herrerae]|uniref:Uncharacterized protein n=1 Tax=Escallonia herrerae TaxID=1293975 RepID=A0AA89BKT1_9ASTE|nr:hypothetical protein RJ639_028192 [Escallonia herrerae]
MDGQVFLPIFFFLLRVICQVNKLRTSNPEAVDMNAINILDTTVPSLYLASNVVIVKTPNSSLPDAVFVSMALLSTKKPGCFGRGDGSSALFQVVKYRSAAVPKLSSNLMPGNLVPHG